MGGFNGAEEQLVRNRQSRDLGRAALLVHRRPAGELPRYRAAAKMIDEADLHGRRPTGSKEMALTLNNTIRLGK